MNSSTCLNCHEPLIHYHFCPACGQKADTHRLTFSHLVHDIIHYFTHADKSIFKLVKLLLTSPGRTVREYLQGTRKRYFPPVNFFLISVAILAISVKVFKTFDMPFMLQRGGVAHSRATGAELLNFITLRINWIYIAFIPILTFLYWIFYVRRNYNYIEHLTAGFYWNGLILLFMAFIISPLMYLFQSLDSYYSLSLIFIGVLTFYYAIAYYRLFAYRSWWKFLRSLVISSLVTSISFGLFIVFIAVFYAVQRS
jgi:hypothetical protein